MLCYLIGHTPLHGFSTPEWCVKNLRMTSFPWGCGSYVVEYKQLYKNHVCKRCFVTYLEVRDVDDATEEALKRESL